MQQKNNVDNFVMVLAGNKCDLDRKEWQIEEDQVSSLKQSLKLTDLAHYHTSAKTGEGVQSLFTDIARKIVTAKLKQQL